MTTRSLSSTFFIDITSDQASCKTSIPCKPTIFIQIANGVYKVDTKLRTITFDRFTKQAYCDGVSICSFSYNLSDDFEVRIACKELSSVTWNGIKAQVKIDEKTNQQYCIFNKQHEAVVDESKQNIVITSTGSIDMCNATFK